MAKKTRNDKTLAIVGLIINIILLPGLGSIIGGKVKTGIWQLVGYIIGWVIFLLGLPLMLVLIGFPMLFLGGALSLSMWIWGIVTGIQMINESN